MVSRSVLVLYVGRCLPCMALREWRRSAAMAMQQQQRVHASWLAARTGELLRQQSNSCFDLTCLARS